MYLFGVTGLRRVAARNGFARAPSSTVSKTGNSQMAKLTATGDLIVGATARSAVGFFLMPITVVKARFESSLFRNETIVGSTKALLKEGGIPALWRGYVPTTLRDAPNAALFLVFYGA